MSLTNRVADLALAVADELRERPPSTATDLPPDNPKDRQFWRRRSDNVLFQYSNYSGQFERIAAELDPTVIIDGGNF